MSGEPFHETEDTDEPSIDDLVSMVSTNITMSSSDASIECIASAESSDKNTLSSKPANDIISFLSTFVGSEASAETSDKNALPSKPTNGITPFEATSDESEPSPEHSSDTPSSEH